MASIERSLWRPLCLHSATTATLEPPWRWFCLHSAFFARPVVPLQQLWSFKEGTRVVLQQLHRNRTFWVPATTERPNHFYGRTRVARRSQPCVKGPLPTFIKIYIMMTWSNGNIFRVNGPFCGEFTGDRWIPRIKASDAELWCFFGLRLNKQLGKQSRGWWFETPSRSWWRHCNVVELDLCCHLMTCMRDTCSSLMCKTNPWISHRNTQPRKHG